MDILRRLFGSTERKTRGGVLDMPLLHLSPVDSFTVRDACEGVAVFGGTGSGKTSGSGHALARAYLNAGFGGLVLTAKPDERILWERYARETGRENSLIVFSPEHPHKFNFMDYELNRPGVGAGLTGNLVRLFVQVLEVAERDKGGRNDSYWQRTMEQLLRNAIDLLVLARGRVSLPDIYEVITSAPQDTEEVASEKWQRNSECFACLMEANERELPEGRAEDFHLTGKYWLSEFPALAQKTRSVIVSTFTSMADGFLRYPLRELFCSTTTILPELTHEGAVIVLDLPVKAYDDIGRFAQVLFKLLWQRSVERRQVSEKTRPVFLWADEAHYFVSRSDLLFQTTARSSRACTVYLSQNRANYEAVFGGSQAKADTDALLGSLLFKVWHANDHVETNRWAAETIGQTVQYRSSSSSTAQGGADGRGPSSTSGASEHMEFQVPAHTFTTLRTGGFSNDLSVDAVLFKPGRIWHATEKNYLRTTFLQE